MNPLKSIHLWIVSNGNVVQIYMTCFASILIGVASIFLSYTALKISERQAIVAEKTFKLEVEKSTPTILITQNNEKTKEYMRSYSVKINNTFGKARLNSVDAKQFLSVRQANFDCSWNIENYDGEEFRFKSAYLSQNISENRKENSINIEFFDSYNFIDDLNVKVILPTRKIANDSYKGGSFTHGLPWGALTTYLVVDFQDQFGDFQRKIFIVSNDQIFDFSNEFNSRRPRTHGRIFFRKDNKFDIENEGACISIDLVLK